MEDLTVKLKYLRIAPRKVRLLADTLRGLPASEAEARLMVSSRRPKDALLKLLRSGIANAKNNHKLDPDRLFVRSVRVDIGPRSKRWTPRAKGSAAIITRLTSHVTLVLGVADKPVSRFTIVRTHPKKTEKPSAKGGKEKKQPKPETPKESKARQAPSAKGGSAPGGKAEPGSLRRVFRRKAI